LLLNYIIGGVKSNLLFLPDGLFGETVEVARPGTDNPGSTTATEKRVGCHPLS
jgi:hypothetical protein